jgi:hypothetical protein
MNVYTSIVQLQMLTVYLWFIHLLARLQGVHKIHFFFTFTRVPAKQIFLSSKKTVQHVRTSMSVLLPGGAKYLQDGVSSTEMTVRFKCTTYI